MKLVTCRFEAGAVNMADAYGKLTGRPAAAMVTRGPGACHGSIGVHVAYQDSTPMLLFVGQIPHEDTGRDAFQEVDYRQMFAPLAKWVTQIDHAKRIPEVVAHAVDVAASGRPGPVVIALSEEMQKDHVSVPDLPRAECQPAFPDPEALLQNARRCWPRRSGRSRSSAAPAGPPQGRAALRRFLLQNNIPVTVGFRRQAHYDGTQENFAGDLGVGSDPGLIGKFKEADLILAIGSRLGDAVTQGYTLLDMAGSVPIIQVLPDGAEIGRVFRTALGHRLRPERLRHRCRGAGAGEAGLGEVDPGTALVAGGAARGAELPGTAEPRHGDARTGNDADAGCHRHHRCRQFRRLGHAVPEFLAKASAISVRPTARWATACRPRSAPRSPFPTGWSSAWSATAAS